VRGFDSARILWEWRYRQGTKAIDRVKHDRRFDVVIDNLENGDRTVLGLGPTPRTDPPLM
jgi:hypothetical protein